MKIKAEKDIPEVHIELVPLIDCVFLLLIFFMTSATMSKLDAPGDVKLPIATNAAKQKDPSRRGIVNVVQPGFRTPQGETATFEKQFLVSGQLVNEEGLTKLMEQEVKREPNLRLYLRADRNVKFAVVRKAMGACAAAGISDVIFATFLQDLSMGKE
ncbi:MAG: biopolymer transporter ExbD [bacterium]